MEEILLPNKIEIVPGEHENESILTMEPFSTGTVTPWATPSGASCCRPSRARP